MCSRVHRQRLKCEKMYGIRYGEHRNSFGVHSAFFIQEYAIADSLSSNQTHKLSMQNELRMHLCVHPIDFSSTSDGLRSFLRTWVFDWWPMIIDVNADAFVATIYCKCYDLTNKSHSIVDYYVLLDLIAGPGISAIVSVIWSFLCAFTDADAVAIVVIGGLGTTAADGTHWQIKYAISISIQFLFIYRIITTSTHSIRFDHYEQTQTGQTMMQSLASSGRRTSREAGGTCRWQWLSVCVKNVDH